MSLSFGQFASFMVCWWPGSVQIQACLMYGNRWLGGRRLWPDGAPWDLGHTTMAPSCKAHSTLHLFLQNLWHTYSLCLLTLYKQFPPCPLQQCATWSSWLFLDSLYVSPQNPHVSYSISGFIPGSLECFPIKSHPPGCAVRFVWSHSQPDST